MPFPTLDEMLEFVSDKIEVANDAAGLMKFAENRDFSGRIAAKSLSTIPKFVAFKEGYGTTANAAVLFVDLRNSTNRAVAIGPKSTYITMHALLPTLAHIVECGEGRTGNFRGDGLFALFGIDGDGENTPDFDFGDEADRAMKCGRAMLEAVYLAVNPTLEANDLPADLQIGVGIDIGQIVITRVGLPNANEVTAYGDAVNYAAKCCGGNGTIIISQSAWDAIPGTPQGKVVANPLGGEGTRRRLEVAFPETTRLLEQ